MSPWGKAGETADGIIRRVYAVNVRQPRVVVLTMIMLLVGARAWADDTSLADAEERKDSATVAALLTRALDVNEAQPDGATALHWAAHWDDLETVKALIASGAAVNVANDYGVTPLSLAATNGSAAVLRVLLDAGANPNTPLPSGETTLMTAVRSESLAAVRQLLAHGAAVDARQASKGQTALMWAAAGHVPEIARTLVEDGADVHTRSKSGFTPLMFAAREGNIDISRMLLTSGADVNAAAADGSTPLLVATVRGHANLAMFFLDHGAHADGDFPTAGYTPLQWASSRFEDPLTYSTATAPDEWSAIAGIPDRDAKIALINALLTHGANIEAGAVKQLPAPLALPGAVPIGNSTSTIGATAFWMAASGGDADVMRLLLASGANPMVRSTDGVTPLIAAASGNVDYAVRIKEKDRLAAILILLELGSDIEAQDSEGYRAIHMAASSGYQDIIALLLARHAELNSKTRDRAEGALVIPAQTPLGMVEGTVVGTGAYFERPAAAAFLRQLGAKSEGRMTLQSVLASLQRNEVQKPSAASLHETVPLDAKRSTTATGTNASRASASYQQAVAFLKGAGVAPDPEKAATLFDRSCEQGLAVGCTSLGLMYIDGRGVPHDDSQAAAYYRRGCDGGETVACTNLGFMYESGRGVLRDDGIAATLYQRGCDGGEVVGCTNLGFMYAAGQGVPKDDEKAIALYTRGCEGGKALGCTHLGLMYEQGRGVAKDYARAVALYRLGCDGGNALGCTALGYMYASARGVSRDAGQAVTLYQRGCDQGVARSCSNLGYMYESGTGVQRDDARATVLYQRACDGGDTQGCWRVGIGLDCTGDCVLTKR
jgi:uncharacterized protein